MVRVGARSVFFVAAVVAPLACQAQAICPVSLPSALDLDKKRAELIGAYPPFPDPVSISALRQQGSKHAQYETLIIGGWRSEIDGRCRSVKTAETQVIRLNLRGDLTPNQKLACEEAISDERLLCDSKNKAASPYYELLREVEAFNLQNFRDLNAAYNDCTRKDECNK